MNPGSFILCRMDCVARTCRHFLIISFLGKVRQVFAFSFYATTGAGQVSVSIGSKEPNPEGCVSRSGHTIPRPRVSAGSSGGGITTAARVSLRVRPCSRGQAIAASRVVAYALVISRARGPIRRPSR